MSISLSIEDLDFVRKLVRDKSAIVLERDKGYLIEARLQPVAAKLGYEDLAAFLVDAKRFRTTEFAQAIVDAMATNETSWFRDRHAFDALCEQVLPRLVEQCRPSRSINIWCAAASSGQEPYSIVMAIRRHFPELADWRLRVLATDISNEMLERVRSGRYTQLEVGRGLPAPMLLRFFERVGAEWEVKPELRNLLDVKPCNLAGTWPPLPQMDLVFLRNVLIYFDMEMKKHVLQKVRSVMRPGAFLFLGSAETTLNLDDSFERVEGIKSGCYQHRSAARASW